MFIAVISIMNRRSGNISEFTVGKCNAGAWLSAFSSAYFLAVMFIGCGGWSVIVPQKGNLPEIFLRKDLCRYKAAEWR